MPHLYIKNKTMHSMVFISLFTLSSVLLSCKKLVQIGDPKMQLANNYVFSNDATVTAAALSMYIHMMENNSNFGSLSVETTTGLCADEFINYSTNSDQKAFSTNSINRFNGFANNLWSSPYQVIYQANLLIEGLANAPTITAPVKQQILGEAKLMRAFCHFYLLNLYGDVPYITTTDYKTNSAINRMPSTEVYQKITADLLDAESLLSDTYVTSERVRPTKWAAKAMLARVYLYTNDWPKAELKASEIIGNSGIYSLEPDLNKVFLNKSKEAIWQLIPVLDNNFNAWESLTFVLTETPTSVVLSDQVLKAFEANDQRKVKWTSSITLEGKTYPFPYKFKIPQGSLTPPTEYCMMFRLAEQYLIRAEARAQQNKLPDAIQDLDAIRFRAGLLNPTPPNIGSDQLLKAIIHERQVELFTEWGHRWFDLKRLHKATEVLAPLKGANWQETDVLYPIPNAQLVNNPAMKQNQGYN